MSPLTSSLPSPLCLRYISLWDSQARLYSRLHNATVTVHKHTIKAPPMANGKPPLNFPVTKGEFEHITRKSLVQYGGT